MVRMAYKYFSQIPSVFIDGGIYVCISVLTFLSMQFGSDEAAKYISATTLFWLKLIIGGSSAGFLAIKMFRSTQFAEHQQAKKDLEGESTATTKPFPPTNSNP